MVQQADSFDLGRLGLTSGEARRLDVGVAFDPFEFAGERYTVAPVPARLDVSRTTGNGFALRLRFHAELEGPCMRCLEDASPGLDVDAREIDQPGDGDELSSPYVAGPGARPRAPGRATRSSLALPNQLLCRPDCAGLCPICGANLNADPDHAHEAEPDPRWAKLRELKLD